MGEGDEVGFVLIPGAGLGTWLWDRVAPELDAPVLPVAIPGRGLSGRERWRVTVAAASNGSNRYLRRRACTATP